MLLVLAVVIDGISILACLEWLNYTPYTPQKRADSFVIYRTVAQHLKVVAVFFYK
jgi:hypothetical protein